MQVGALFTVFDPILSGLGNQHCSLSLGPVLGGSINVMKYPPYYKRTDNSGSGSWVFETLTGGSLYLLVPIRWEINFSNISDFNIFIDIAPVGVAMNFVPYKKLNILSTGKYSYTTEYDTGFSYTARYGIGLRYRIPGKK